MADPYADLANADADVQYAIADAMEARSLEPAQIAIRRDYMAGIILPDGAFAVEMGSGTGHITCDLIDNCGAACALGIEPSEILVARARALHGHRSDVRFEVGNAKATGLDDNSVDLVLFHTVLCHVPGPEGAVAEAYRVLKPGGILVICDGDYDLTTVEIAECDPLQQAVKFMIQNYVHDVWLPRKFVPLVAGAGFEPGTPRTHGYLARGEAPYFMSVIERGLGLMQAQGILTSEGADGLRTEARARIAENRFYGFIPFLSLIARKPG